MPRLSVLTLALVICSQAAPAAWGKSPSADVKGARAAADARPKRVSLLDGLAPGFHPA